MNSPFSPSDKLSDGVIFMLLMHILKICPRLNINFENTGMPVSFTNRQLDAQEFGLGIKKKIIKGEKSHLVKNERKKRFLKIIDFLESSFRHDFSTIYCGFKKFRYFFSWRPVHYIA